MRKIPYLLILSTIITFVHIGAQAAYYDTNWSKTYVDKDPNQNWGPGNLITAGNCGWYSSLDVSSYNNPRVCYYYDSALKYAYKNGTNPWVVMTADSNCHMGPGTPTALKLNSSGYPYISYCDLKTYDLKVAYWNGSLWTIQTVDSNGTVGYHSSISIDSSDNPHVSYYEASNGDLKYASYNGSTWTIETVDGNDPNNDWVGLWTSLEIDSNDNPHISYYDSTNMDLKYAYHNGTSWEIQTVDSTGSNCGQGCSLELNSEGKPIIAYHWNPIQWAASTAPSIKLATYSGSSWTIETVPTWIWPGPYICLKYGGDGKLRITYTDLAKNDSNDGKKKNPTLRYGIRDGATWTMEWVDGGKTDSPESLETREKGFYNSVGSGPNNKTHISYYDSSENALKHAVK